MELEFGGGDNPRRPTFKQCDVRDRPGIDYVCQAWDIVDHVQPETVEVIYSRHFFEHLTFAQGRETLQAWRSILVPDGVVHIIVPDMLFHMAQWLRADRDSKAATPNGWSHLDWAQKGIWGQQREGGEVWDLHKSGYDYPFLRRVALDAGFRDVKKVDDGLVKNLCVKFRK